MRKTLGVLVLFVGTCSAASTRAGEITRVKCGPNQDRVWVYDSLTSFDVQSKIRCGETVEIVGRVKGFVLVRTQDGSEGYIPDNAVPSVAPEKGSGGTPTDGDAASSTASLGSIARRVAARTAASPASPADTFSAIPNTARPTGTTNTGLVSEPMATEIVTRSAVAPPGTPVASSSGAAIPPSNRQSAPSILKSANTAAGIGAVHPTPSRESATAPVSAISAFLPNVNSASFAASRAITSDAKIDTPQPPAQNTHPTQALLEPTPAVNAMMADNVPAASLARETSSMRPVSVAVDSDEFPDFQPVSDGADPACQSFFSAYGLAPSQLKWIAQNRKKRFPSICPAPDPSKVDFVVIFTHDVDFYNSTMPAPVHTDRSGFSDFSPMVGVDTALMSNSAADKARHDFVWVFLVKRGAFDPATFSPRRRYQFMKVESSSLGSKAGVKTVEDAFQFLALQEPSH